MKTTTVEQKRRRQRVEVHWFRRHIFYTHKQKCILFIFPVEHAPVPPREEFLWKQLTGLGKQFNEQLVPKYRFLGFLDVFCQRFQQMHV